MFRLFILTCLEHYELESLPEPKKLVVTAPPKPPSEIATDFALPMKLPKISSVIAKPLSRPKRKAVMRATTTTQPSRKRERSSPSITESDESMVFAQTCPPNLLGSSAPSKQKRLQMLKEQQKKNQFIISTIKNTAARNQNSEPSNLQVGPCSPDQPYPTSSCLFR